MMKNYDTDDTFLGRWLAGELSEEELIQFKKTDAYKQFKLINDESQLLSGPDINVEAALQNVKKRTQSKAAKPKTFRLWFSVGMAAILVLSLGYYMNSSKTINNGIGSTQTIVLEDGSKINLNANSSITYKRFFWKNNKSVTLNGEAYFTISKGDGFKVETSKGTVNVLGTQFNIKDRTTFELKCFEGKVEFLQKNKSSSPKVLTKGMHIKIKKDRIEDYMFQDNVPNWTRGFSTFDEEPIQLVLEELTQYFDITFDTGNINTDRLFSGRFKHDNLDLALKSTLIPMGIEYELKGNNIILSE